MSQVRCASSLKSTPGSRLNVIKYSGYRVATLMFPYSIPLMILCLGSIGRKTQNKRPLVTGTSGVAESARKSFVLRELSEKFPCCLPILFWSTSGGNGTA